MNLAHCIIHGHTVYDLGEADAKRFAPVFNNLEHLMARAPEVLGRHYEISYPGRQWTTARNLRSLPLGAEWQKAAAHFGQFYGFERPLYFGKTREPVLSFGRPDWFEPVEAEVMQAHRRAAVFDQSSLGKIEVEGADAEAFLQRVCANDMARAPGRVVYTPVLNERGGFESDLTAQRIGDSHYRLFVGTGSVKRDLAWLRRHADGFRVSLRDRTEDFAVIALMGPESTRIVAELGAVEFNDLGYFRTGALRLLDFEVRAARLSYVGEHGWEISCDRDHARTIYAAMKEAGALPSGLFAQTSMRIEKRFLAYGHELDTDVTPMEAGLEFAVAWETDFIGREALVRRRDVRPSHRMVTILLDDDGANPQGHEPIRLGDEIVGETTSAAYGFRVGRPVAVGYVKLDEPEGAEVTVDIARELFTARLTLAAAFDPDGARMRRRDIHRRDIHLS